jgi:hypothetical protein
LEDHILRYTWPIWARLCLLERSYSLLSGKNMKTGIYRLLLILVRRQYSERYIFRRYDIARKSFSKECHSKDFFSKECRFQGKLFPRNFISKEFFSKECRFQGIFLQGIPFQGIFQNTLFHILVTFLHN